MANSKADSLNANQLREKILETIKENPDGLKTGEIAEILFASVKDAAEFKRLHARLSWALGTLKKAKHVIKKGSAQGGLWLMHNGRPQPQVHDLPENGKASRGRPRKQNGAFNGNGVLVGYILRDIRSKLTELEALGY